MQDGFHFYGKVFLWRPMLGGLPLAITLKRKHIPSGTSVFCAIIDKDSEHKFISCHVAKSI
jgi:hypothetical protein